MTNDYDQSHIEKKYFIDGNKYNCPFCNIRNVQYGIKESGNFHWSREKACYFFLVKCSHCSYVSLHLSNYNLSTCYHGDRFSMPPKQCVEANGTAKDIPIVKNGKEIKELDDIFFYHQPTSFFTIDNRVPAIIRELISEAEGCRKMGYLVGASGCLRKGIYELLDLQKIPKDEFNQAGEIAEMSYADRIKQLKGKFPAIEPDFFDILAGIQGMTSDALHEDGWDSFDAPKLTLLIETTKEILYEIYVFPDERKKKKSAIQQLREGFEKDKEAKVVEVN